MPQKIADFDSNYQESFEGNDIKGMSVYTQVNNEKIGTVSHHSRWPRSVPLSSYWLRILILAKVLLPVGRTQIDHEADRVYAIGMTKSKRRLYLSSNRPQNLDYDHEEQVRGVYRNQAAAAAPTTALPHLVPSTPLTTVIPTPTSKMRLCTISMLRIIKTKLYQERLVANKQRVKTGK